jgi:integrase
VKLIEAAAGMRQCAMIVFDFETALRRGELAGLKWTDVDLARQSAVIRTSVAQVPGQKLLKATKTNLVAPVALSQTAVDALEAQMEIQAFDKIVAEGSYED